jgi:acyl-CoA thioester hydrolase
VVQRTKSHRIEWGETDAAGIVFYPNYFRWFDQATHELFRELGYSISTMLAQGCAVPIIESGGRFLASLAYDDELVITSTVGDVRTRAFRVDHSITRDGVVVCEGYEVRMFVRLGTSEEKILPQRIPNELRALMAPEPA